MKKIIYSSFVVTAVTLLSACASMKNSHDAFAEVQLQQRQLANGDTVYLNTNLKPTASWECKQLAISPAYNWAMLQTQGQFAFKGGYGLLADNAVSYANQQKLTTNYINLVIPREVTLNSFNLHPRARAFAEYYQCLKINPEHTLAVIKKLK